MKNIIFNALQICIVLLTIVAASEFDDQDWLSFKKLRRKNYRNQAEESQRYQIFKYNSLLIKKHNAPKQTLGALPSFTVGLNDFSDLVCEFLYF
jgi:hypothetical protein